VGEKADTEDSVNKVEASAGDAYPHMKEDKVCLILTFLGYELKFQYVKQDTSHKT
jgi:hypothetical protein